MASLWRLLVDQTDSDSTDETYSVDGLLVKGLKLTRRMTLVIEGWCLGDLIAGVRWCGRSSERRLANNKSGSAEECRAVLLQTVAGTYLVGC